MYRFRSQTQNFKPGRLSRLSRRGMGDVLSDAQTALRNAGYTGAVCRTERVSLPMADPSTGRNYYDQNVCNAPGHTGGFMADVVVDSIRRPYGSGVNLAGERVSLINAGGGNDTSYFDAFGAASLPLRYADASPGAVLRQTDPLPPVRATRAVSVTLENVSRPGLPFQVGDSWVIRLAGTPGASISVSARQDGRDLGTTDYGALDSSGQFTKSGQFSADTAGAWFQRWKAAGLSADLSFTVLPKPSSPNQQEQTVSSAPPPLTGGAAARGAFDLSNPLLLGALGVGALLLFGGRK